MTSPADDPAAGPKDPNPVTQAIWSALGKHGVPERQRNSFLSQALGLSYSQARRKLNGESEWTTADLRTLASELGIPLTDLMGGVPPEAPAPGERGSLMLGEQPIACQVVLGEPLGPEDFCEFVAVGIPGAWTVWHHDRLPAEAGAGRRVLSVSLTPRQDRPITIAVLDDNQASADEVADYLISNGLHAQAFNSAASLREALKKRNFDGFILDWRLSVTGTETAHELITHVRQGLRSSAPIFVLTGVDPNDEPVLDELEREIALNNIRLAFKPYKLRLLLMDLKLAVAGTRRP